MLRSPCRKLHCVVFKCTCTTNNNNNTDNDLVQQLNSNRSACTETIQCLKKPLGTTCQKVHNFPFGRHSTYACQIISCNHYHYCSLIIRICHNLKKNIFVKFYFTCCINYILFAMHCIHMDR